MLIEDYELEVTTPPCMPGEEKYSAFARLKQDITEALPYLNAVWKGAIYDHEEKVLTWKMGGRAVSVRPGEIAVSNLQDRDEAQEVIERLIRMINRTWERRNEITPSYQKRERLKPLDVYKLLPRTNCRECGYASCFVFASKLTVGEVELSACKLLFTDGYREQRQKLEAMLENAAF